MRLSFEFDYPAPLAQIMAMLADPIYVRARGLLSPDSEPTVDVAQLPDGRIDVQIRRHIPATQVPAAIASVIGATPEVRQIEVWNAPQEDAANRNGTLAIEIVGVPLQLTGTMSATELSQSQTRLQYAGELNANVPLFASAIEAKAEEIVASMLQAEHEVGLLYLENQSQTIEETIQSE